MRRLFLLLCLLFAVPALGAGLLDNRPSATLGAINNSSDFLPVREAFKLNLISSTPESIKLRFVPTEGYYLYRHRFAFKTEPADIALGTAQLPPGEAKHDEFFGDVEVYHGILDVDIPRPANDSRPFTLVVSYQGCADKGLCYPPETEHLSIDGTTVTSTGTPAKAWNWRELALFFLAGLGLTFTPCVLPMLPILSGVVLRGQVGGLRGFSLSLAYVLPMAACFALLGALMGMFGAQLNLQARLQSVWVLVPFALFFAIFALAMFGVFELKLPQAISNRLDRVANRTQGGSLWGAAVLGVVSSLLVSPCVSAPLAGALLYISASGDALGGGLKLFALGLGMGAPLLLVATGGAAWLPKSGPWLVSVKNAIGVLLLGLAIGLLSRVLPGPVTLLLIGALAAGVSLFLGTLEFTHKAPPASCPVAGCVFAGLRAGLLVRRPERAKRPFQPHRPRTTGCQRSNRQRTTGRPVAHRQHPGRTGQCPGPGQGGRSTAVTGLVRRLVHQLQSDRARGAEQPPRAGAAQGLPAGALRHHGQQCRATRPARSLHIVRPASPDVLRQKRQRNK
jgi:thioredoxin:protein disulfide reductase